MPALLHARALTYGHRGWFGRRRRLRLRLGCGRRCGRGGSRGRRLLGLRAARLGLLLLSEFPLNVLEGGHQGRPSGGRRGPARDALLPEEPGGRLLLLLLLPGQGAAGLCGDVERLRRREQEAQ